MKKLASMLLLLTAALFACVMTTSCSSDDDDSPSMSFDTQTIVGTWEITNVENKSLPEFQNGATITFYSDGTCIGVMDMENAYRIKDGKIFTYYSKTDEPMYVYSLLSKQDNSLTVRVNGTLDESNVSVTIQLKKIL